MTDKPIDNATTFGERLRNARERQGLTGASLANMTALDQSNISKLELGKIAYPSSEHLFPLADALNVSARWLVTGLEAQDPKDAPVAAPLSENMQRLVSHIQTLDDTRLNGLFALLGVKHE